MTHSLAPASESCFSLAPLPGTASAALSHPSCESYKINPKIKTKPHNKNSLSTHQIVRKGTLSQKLASIRESGRPSPSAGHTEPEPEDAVLWRCSSSRSQSGQAIYWTGTWRQRTHAVCEKRTHRTAKTFK
uniref:(northern house mosquito) hypothetical protein n=1 Tax=Culex pipiens TaxID=7175 RepID=A0A8D8N343_CULPI